MTLSSLRSLTRKVLAARAKKYQIAGWHQMTKDELVTALAVRLSRRPRVNGGSARGRHEAAAVAPVRFGENGHSNGDHGPKTTQRALGGGHLNGRRLLKSSVGQCRTPESERRTPVNGRRLLKSSINATAPRDARDLLTAEAHDPFWVHVRWTLSRDMLDRAEAALGTQWHHALPVLRVFDVTNDEGAASSQVRVQDVEIHGDVDHWYLPVEHPPRTYKVQIGYRAANGLFFVMAQSNRVQTPRPGSHSLRVRDAAKRRPTGDASASTLDLEKMPSYNLRALPTAKLGNGHGMTTNTVPARAEDEAVLPPPVELRLHAELIVHGSTDPHAELKLLGDRIPVSRDGTFSHRFSLPEGRQVIDAVVTTRNGCHQRTIVLGIERNTKELEPQWFDEING
jgi:hypothetical protein